MREGNPAWPLSQAQPYDRFECLFTPIAKVLRKVIVLPRPATLFSEPNQPKIPVSLMGYRLDAARRGGTKDRRLLRWAVVWWDWARGLAKTWADV